MGRVLGNDTRAFMEDLYFFPTMRVSEIKICQRDFRVTSLNSLVRVISEISFSLDASEKYEDISQMDNKLTLYEHGGYARGERCTYWPVSTTDKIERIKIGYDNELHVFPLIQFETSSKVVC